MHPTARSQAQVRRRIAHAKVLRLIHKRLEKRRDPESKQWYYINKKSGEASWTRPILLINAGQDIELPKSCWEPFDSGDGRTLFSNPRSGHITWMTEERAASVLQKAVRQRQGRDFSFDFRDLVRVLRIQTDVKERYEKRPTHLASMVNYAL